MTTEVFNSEMKRIYGVFGEKHYPHERIRSIWSHWRDLPDNGFIKLVSHFINTRKIGDAPLPQDFIDAAHRERKNQFNRDVQGAADAVFDWSKQKGLKAFLDENYPGCKTLWEAVEVERIRNWGKP